ncbi:MAG: phosphoesterase [Mycobacterium sp.]|nr:phosphoesterase [Mycobacterium sp.]
MRGTTMSYAKSIGRLGALAVALGIGYGVSDAPAFADTIENSGSESSSASSAPGASPRQAGKARVSASPRRGGAARESSELSVGDNAPRPAASSKPKPVAAEDNGATPIGQRAALPAPSAAVSEQTAPVPSAPVAVSPSSTNAPVVFAPAPATTVAAPAPAATITPAARPAASTARALPASTTVKLVSTALAPLLGGGTGGAPGQAPLLFSVLAWARKEFERLVGITPAAAVTATSQTLSPNLLVNPGAELGDPSLSGYSAVSIPGWTLTGTPTVIKYGASRTLWPIGVSFPMPNLPSFLGYPKAKSGPPDGGNQFFGGGDVATGTLTQTVDLRAAAADIDKGAVPFNLSAWLGGYLSDPSGASVKVDFLDGNKTYLGSANIARVGPLQRFFQTGFKERSTTGTLPTGTRYAQVALTLEDRHWVTFGFPMLLGGVDFDYNYAFADNLGFTIGANLPAPPAPTPPVSTVGELDHVFMVYMENKGYTDIVGSTKAPFLNSLIDAYGHANQYHGLTHPSLPNYYPVIGGTDFGLTYNCDKPCIDADTTLVSNIIKAGKTWKGYAQSLQPGANPLVSSGDYASDQLPFPAFKSIANDPAAVARIVPLEQMAEDLKSAATAPNYAWFAANEDFNGEGPVDFPWGMLRFALSQLEPGNPYNIPALDEFLSKTVPVVLNSAVWKDPARKSALIVTFDEDNNNTSLGFGNQGNRVIFVVIPSEGAVASGMRGGAFTATNHYNHYSLLRFINESLGLPTLTNNDKFAAPLNEFWNTAAKSGEGSALV